MTKIKPVTNKAAQEWIRAAYDSYLMKHPYSEAKFQKALVAISLNKQGQLPDMVLNAIVDPEAKRSIEQAEACFKKENPELAYRFPRNLMFFNLICLQELEKESEAPMEVLPCSIGYEYV